MPISNRLIVLTGFREIIGMNDNLGYENKPMVLNACCALNLRFEFKLYHGVVKYGILVKDISTTKIYCIHHSKIKNYNENKRPVNEIGKEINLESIRSWSSIEGKRSDRNSPQITIQGSRVCKMNCYEEKDRADMEIEFSLPSKANKIIAHKKGRWFYPIKYLSYSVSLNRK